MFALVMAVAFGVLTTGCTSTVQGAAVKPNSSVPSDDVAPLEESALDGLMLTSSALDKISGVELESLYDAEEMNDNSDVVSDVDCLGAIYPGEDAVYDGSDWTAVRDELLLEAGADEDGRLVEQTLVLFDTPDAAVEFFETSADEVARVRAGQRHRGRQRRVDPRRGAGRRRAIHLAEGGSQWLPRGDMPTRHGCRLQFDRRGLFL